MWSDIKAIALRFRQRLIAMIETDPDTLPPV